LAKTVQGGIIKINSMRALILHVAVFAATALQNATEG
jgi:hypothetical protein